MSADQFNTWWEEFRQSSEFGDLLRRDIARAGFYAGKAAAQLEKIQVEERVREERNQLAEHLRNVTMALPDPLFTEQSAAVEYLRQIGAI